MKKTSIIVIFALTLATSYGLAGTSIVQSTEGSQLILSNQNDQQLVANQIIGDSAKAANTAPTWAQNLFWKVEKGDYITLMSGQKYKVDNISLIDENRSITLTEVASVPTNLTSAHYECTGNDGTCNKLSN